eukprot:761733-Hanusia_phi.AAC.1
MLPEGRGTGGSSRTSGEAVCGVRVLDLTPANPPQLHHPTVTPTCSRAQPLLAGQLPYRVTVRRTRDLCPLALGGAAGEPRNLGLAGAKLPACLHAAPAAAALPR